MVVEGDHDLEVGVVVEVPDPDVQAVAAIPRLPGAIAVGIAARAGPGVVAGPGRKGRRRRLVQRPVRCEDEDLGAPRLGLGGGGHHLDLPVAVEVGGGEAAHLVIRVAGGGGRGRPARLEVESAPRPLVGVDLVALAEHDLDDPVAVEVGDDVRRVDAAPVALNLVEQGAVRGVHGEPVVGHDDLRSAAVAEVGDEGGGEPAGVTGQVPHEDGRADRPRARLGEADRVRLAAGGADAAAARAARGRSAAGGESHHDGEELERPVRVHGAFFPGSPQGR